MATSCARSLPVRGSEFGPGVVTMGAGRAVVDVVLVAVVDEVVGVVDVAVVPPWSWCGAVVVVGAVEVVGGGATRSVWARSSQSSCAAISDIADQEVLEGDEHAGAGKLGASNFHRPGRLRRFELDARADVGRHARTVGEALVEGHLHPVGLAGRKAGVVHHVDDRPG